MVNDRDCCPTVCVALPSYNGAKFIGRQIESVMNQTYPSLKLIVRDDGSTDDTVSIVKKYVQRFGSQGRIELMQDMAGNLGCPDSFYRILKENPGFDYYAFCDQDDLWFPNKIEKAVGMLQGCGSQEEPAVYCSSFDYVAEDGSFIRHAPVQPEHIPFNLTLFYTPGLGFTIVFNRAACEKFIVEPATNDELHDRWLLRCAASMGTLVYDKSVTAEHIRHQSAVTAGDRGWADLFKDYLSSELFGDLPVLEQQHIAYFLHEFKASLDDEQKRTLQLFSVNGHRLRKVLYPHKLRSTIGGDFALRLLFLFGRM